MLVASAVCAVLVSAGLTVGYFSLALRIDARLAEEGHRTPPRVYARPFELRRGQALSDRQLIARLNDLGYAHRPRAERRGEFAVGRDAVVLSPRGGDAAGATVRVVFSHEDGDGPDRTGRVERLEIVGGPAPALLTLEPPVLTTLVSGEREKQWKVPLDRMPRHLVDAVLAIEDRRFYDHPGVDVVRIVGAAWTNLRGGRPYLVGASTLTQQLVKNLFLTPEKTFRRKITEQVLAVMLEQRLTKTQILELYLNEVYLGQRGSFAIHGVAQAARFFFEKDVTNLSLGEAATIAGVIQAPHTHSPFRSSERARERRNVVLGAMATAGVISEAVRARAGSEPLVIARRAIEAQAPYFLDVVGLELSALGADLARAGAIHTTLDLHLQRLAQEAVRDGLGRVDRLLAGHEPAPRAQAALIAVAPATGDILALVGGRSYGESQFNRALQARRQPGSVFKPFVYLTAFEAAAAAGRTDLTPATLIDDRPTRFVHDREVYAPGNYRDRYDGLITLRRALAQSRNVPAVKLAESVGFERVAELWQRIGTETVPQALPSIALGVFEASPLEIATAYTLFPNLGAIRPLRAITRIEAAGTTRDVPPQDARRVARADTAYLVTHMMQSVLDDGTGAAARRQGLHASAAGKSGTTNRLRDAWFAGFTPDLLTVVWVGLDDNAPLGLSGAEAALPIWTAFMTGAVAGQVDRPFDVPPGVGFVTVDPATGEIALPGCPTRMREAFLFGTEPLTACHRHRSVRYQPSSRPGYN